MFRLNKRRIKLIAALIIGVFMLLGIRIAYVTSIWGGELSVITDKQYIISENTSNIKYSLQDSKGRELLKYNLKYYFVVDLNTFIKNNKDTDLSKINSIVYILRNYKKEYDLSDLKDVNRSQKLYYDIDEETYNKLDEIKGVRGTYLFKRSEVDRSNSWKYENMLSSSLNSDNKLKSEGSIERYIYDKTKDNEYPKVTFDKDLMGNITQVKNDIPENNTNVRLTTDRDLEEKIKNIILGDRYKSYEQIGVIVMEPSSGKIKAMVQRDDPEPNILLGAATENGYEPGSIFKTVVQEAAMEYANIPNDQKFLCEEEKKNLGYIDMERAYIISCNSYFRKLGNKVKFTNILPFAKKQGLFEKVLNFDGNGEVKGDYSKEKYQDSNFSIGQSMRITPIQAIGIVNTIVNNGVYIKPYLIDSFINSKDEVIESMKPETTRVIGSDTAKVIKNQMIKVVEDPMGTGKAARMSGIEVGGKTGTTERSQVVKKNNASTGEEEQSIEKHSDGWFIGFAKLNGTYYTTVIFVKDIKVVGEEAGNTAVPIFKEIVENLK